MDKFKHIFINARTMPTKISVCVSHICEKILSNFHSDPLKSSKLIPSEMISGYSGKKILQQNKIWQFEVKLTRKWMKFEHKLVVLLVICIMVIWKKMSNIFVMQVIS